VSIDKNTSASGDEVGDFVPRPLP